MRFIIEYPEKHHPTTITREGSAEPLSVDQLLEIESQLKYAISEKIRIDSSAQLETGVLYYLRAKRSGYFFVEERDGKKHFVETDRNGTKLEKGREFEFDKFYGASQMKQVARQPSWMRRPQISCQ